MGSSWPKDGRRAGRAGGALLMLVVCFGCSGGPDSAGWQRVPLTLAWDQPDGQAQYYHLRTGVQLVRSDRPAATLYLVPGTHIIELEACNPSGCSEPTIVTVTWRGRWTLESQGVGRPSGALQQDALR